MIDMEEDAIITADINLVQKALRTGVISCDEVTAAAELSLASEEYLGFCLTCGAEHDGVEPDARRYECGECGEHTVFGAKEILIMGL